jgi:alkanesulfonate monooxygenase
MSKVGNVEFGWFLPTPGDGKHIGVPPEREPSASYLVEVAQAAERAGYEFVLIPAGGDCLDGWIVGSWIAAHTTNLKPLVALRPGFIAPVLAARMGAALDQLSQGRLRINVVTGHYTADLKATGDPLYHDHDERYVRTKEFVDIVKGVWNLPDSGQGAGFDYKGKHFVVEGAVSKPALKQSSCPPFYFGGSSEAGKQVAAEIADVYLMWAEPLSWIQEQIAGMESQLKALEESKGIKRSLRYGLRAQLIVRETEEEAWEAANEIISKASPEQRKAAEALHSQTDAANQKRQIELFKNSRDQQHLIGPNLWAGMSALRGGGAVALVGTPEQVSDRIVEFVQAGISSFILSGYPHLEEAEISGRLLLPLVKKKLQSIREDQEV